MRLPPVLEAKLARPQASAGGRLRPAAVARLESLLASSGATIIVAPPGFGARDLVATWEATVATGPVAWIRADEDDDGTRLLLHAAEALRRVLPRLSFDAEELAVRRLPGVLHEVGALGETATIVIDDVDRLPEEVRRRLLAAVRDRPPNGRLVLIGADTGLAEQWPGGLLERPPILRGDDLLLSEHDVGELVSAAGITPEPDAVARLHAATGGWPAPVFLTVAAAADTGSLPRFRVDDPAVASYLHRVACERLDPDLRAFAAAVIPAGTVDVDTAQRLTGDDRAGARLRELVRLGIHEALPGGFRPHRLVRAHVEDELRQLDPAGLATTRSTAAGLHARAGRVDAAIGIIGRDPRDPGLVSLLLSAHHIWSAGAHAEEVHHLVARCLAGDPQRVELHLVKAWAEAFLNERQAAAATVALVRSLRVPEPLRTLVEGETEAILSNLARLEGRMEDALAHARAMVAAGTPTPPPPDYRGALPDAAEAILGLALFCAGELEESRRVMLEATGRDHWTPVALAGIHGVLALLAWLSDDLVAPIHAAIAASHVDRRASQGQFLGPAALALIRPEDPAADSAATWTEHAALALDAPLSTVLAAAVRAVRTDDRGTAERALARARAVADAAPQPGVLPMLVARTAAEIGTDPSARRPGEALTDGERRVVLALAGNLTEREVAEELHLSHNTVRTYRRRAYRKLGVTNRADAVAAVTDTPHG